MHIFIAGDRNYILGLAALLKSIDINVSKSPETKVKISIVSVGIDAQSKQKLETCCKYPIAWHDLQSNYGELLSLYGSKLSYVRLEPGKYTQETEKLIWLDIDTIVLGSLEPLWNLDLETMPIAAATNVWGNPNNSQDRSPYFNAGILVYNMKLWQQEQLSEKLLENARANLWGDHDQGALNCVLAGRWKQLDRIWNNHDTDDMSTKIMHFMSKPKPWESSAPNQLWLDMLSQTPFQDELETVKDNLNWLESLKLKYRKIDPWLREPTIKFKSYIKNKTR